MEDERNPSASSITEASTQPKRVLVAFGTKLGGTEGIARIVGETLASQGFRVDVAPAKSVRDLEGYDAVLVGGALYANRWHDDAWHLVDRHVEALRRVPVWFFSSGPLDDSADREDIPPSNHVLARMERVGAIGHTTFGGRLEAGAREFPAAAMAKTMAGDYRNPERIRAWALARAREIPTAVPGVGADAPAYAASRLVAYAIVASLVGGSILAALLLALRPPAAMGLFGFVAPIVALVASARYFRPRGAREPAVAAAVWTAVAAMLDASVIATHPNTQVSMTRWLAWAVLPLALAYVATRVSGFLYSTMPWPKPKDRASSGGAVPTR